jgi:hypothetical protein
VMLLGREKIIYESVIRNSINNGTLSKSWDEIFIRGRAVTPQVFGFHICIAFHKHEHHSSYSCLYFTCNMSMQHTPMCLFCKLLAYEMWVVQHIDATWVSHTLKHGNVGSIT